MRRYSFLIVFFAIVASMEYYVYRSLKSAFKTPRNLRIARIVYFISLAVTVASVVTMFVVFSRGYVRSNIYTNILIGLTMTFWITKLVYAVFLLVEDVYRLGLFGLRKTKSAFKKEAEQPAMASRRDFIAKLGLVVSGLPFFSFLYGVIGGKYNFTVHKQELWFDDLPAAFDGLRIVQVSDIHSGSFDSFEGVAEGVQMIQDQNPDLILFTGDLVNNRAEEVEPYIGMFSQLKAPLGKFSVLGNHDYGDYVRWETEAQKTANLKKLCDHHAAMGFELMRNRNVTVERAGEKIRLAGVENWGEPPFPQYGDLDRAFAGANAGEFRILLSHDPTHWDRKVRDFREHVHLTLSGHTHGAQLGVEIPGVKWSPVQYRYDRWAGLYEEAGQCLYVNRGFGFIGFPGRVGIWPEITVLELRKGTASV